MAISKGKGKTDSNGKGKTDSNRKGKADINVNTQPKVDIVDAWIKGSERPVMA